MYRFSKGTRFLWHGVGYEVLYHQPGQDVQLVDLSSGIHSTVTEEQTLEEWFHGNLTFAVAQTTDEAELVTKQEFPTLADCSWRQQLTARYRYWVIAPLLKIAPNERTRRMVRERVNEVQKKLVQGNIPVPLTEGDEQIRTDLSVATLYRWLQTYDQAGGDIRSLIPN